MSRHFPVRLVNVFSPKNKNHFLDLIGRREKFARGLQRQVRRLVDWITVSPTTDCRKRYRFDLIFHRKLQRIAIAIRECPRFVLFPAAPDWSDSVNHEPGGQTIPARNLRFAGPATAERAAFGEQFRSGRVMNRAIDAATAEKCRVSRVHNRIDLELCDVAAENLNLAQSDFFSLTAQMRPKIEVVEYWSVGQKRKSILHYSSTPFFRPLTARADQFSTIRSPAACTETGRAGGWGGLAKILLYPA